MRGRHSFRHCAGRHPAIARGEQRHLVAQPAEGPGQRAGDVGQAPGLGERRPPRRPPSAPGAGSAGRRARRGRGLDAGHRALTVTGRRPPPDRGRVESRVGGIPPSPRTGRAARDRGAAELAAQHPELAPAVALERELFDGERRLQRRMGTPWIDAPPTRCSTRLSRGECLVELGAPRPRLVGSAAAAPPGDRRAAAPRRARRRRRPPAPRTWTAAPQLPDWSGDGSTLGAGPAGSARAARGPAWSATCCRWRCGRSSTRAADVLMQRVSVDGWGRPTCPMCGGRPVFARARHRRRAPAGLRAMPRPMAVSSAALPSLSGPRADRGSSPPTTASTR